MVVVLSATWKGVTVSHCLFQKLPAQSRFFAGTLLWSSPTMTSEIDHYVVYFAEAQGTFLVAVNFLSEMDNLRYLPRMLWAQHARFTRTRPGSMRT